MRCYQRLLTQSAFVLKSNMALCASPVPAVLLLNGNSSRSMESRPEIFQLPGTRSFNVGRRIKVSAPGKIILHGEHAVVYKKSAIAASLGMRTELELQHTDSGSLQFGMDRLITDFHIKTARLSVILETVQVNFEEPEKEVDWQLVENLRTFVRDLVASRMDEDLSSGHSSTSETAVASFLYLFLKLCKLSSCKEVPSLSVRITSEIAISAGLGSSAAFSVCVASSLLAHFGIIVCDPKICETIRGKLIPESDQLSLINHWAFIMEKIIHGTASGIDNAVSTYGGIIKFSDQQLTHIPCRLKLDVIVVDTLVQRDTRRMVEMVKKKRKLYPSVVNPILEAIDSISETAFKILRAGNGSPTPNEYNVLSELITMNHQLLASLGVSHPALDAVVSSAAKWGQAAKLTGAGGGGCAIIVLDPDLKNFHNIREALLADLRQLEFKPHTAELGGPGVLYHPTPTLS